MVFQSRLVGGILLLFINKYLVPPTPICSPWLNGLHPGLNHPLYTDFVEKRWLGWGGTSHLPNPSLYLTEQLYKLESCLHFSTGSSGKGSFRGRKGRKGVSLLPAPILTVISLFPIIGMLENVQQLALQEEKSLILFF